MIEKNRKKTGFTLTEILIYIGVLVIIVSAVSSFFLWANRSNAKSKAMNEVLYNARRAMEIMTQEIKESKSIYTPTTISHQLSLETTNHLPEGEETSFIDFYLCGTHICFKKESQDAVVLTSDKVEVSNLEFTQIATASTIPSIQINLKINYKTPSGRPEYQASINTTSTASLR